MNPTTPAAPTAPAPEPEPPAKPAIPPMPASAPRSPEPIRVKELWLTAERDVPLLDSQGGMRIIKAGKGRSGTEVQIQFEPWQRHHRIRELESGQIRSEFCLPEGFAIYVPERAKP